MIDVRRLRLLAELDRLGTVAAVADELRVTASGVSMQLSALEKEVDVPLTQRQGRRLALTPAGKVLATHARAIVDRISLAELEVDALRAGSSGRFNLAAFPTAARTFVADACRRVREDAGSTIDLRLTTVEPEAALDALILGSADLAVIHSYSHVPRDVPSDVATRVIGAEPIRLAVPTGRRPGTPGDHARLEDYAGQPWIAPLDDVTCFAMLERACAAAGFRPHVVAESGDFAVQLALVAAGLGVALVPDLAVDHVPDGVRLLPTAVPLERAFFVASRAARFTDPGVRRLSDVIAESAGARLRARR